MSMKMINGEMTFTPGTSSEEIKIHMEIADIKWKIAVWKNNSSPIAKANTACERVRLKELRNQLKNIQK
jgi:hypothetical protein